MTALRSALAEHPDGAVLRVWVVPGASSTEITGMHGDRIKVRVAAPPRGGAANAAVEALLEGVLGVPSRLVAGHHHRAKSVVVAAPIDRVERGLKALLVR